MLYKTPAILRSIYPSLTWKVETNEKVIYLTFDDGPIPEVTPFVLNTLQQYNAKATFFCIGHNIQKHPEIFQQVNEAGHSIGNHTFHHLKGWKTEDSLYLQDTHACREIISQYLPDTKLLFRPPYGRIKRSQIISLKKEYQIIMWSTLSQDYRKDISPKECLQNTINATQNGSIVLFHDSLKAQQNMSFALPEFLEHFTEKGFSFRAL